MTWTKLNRPDLSIRLTRRRLLKRQHPYWHLFSYGRHLGYLKRSKMRTYWVARVRVCGFKYIQRRIGQTDDQNKADGITYFSFEQGARMAHEWFQTCNLRDTFTDAIPIGIREDLLYTPVGSVYTIGHALKDYIEWKRLVAKKSYLQTIVTLTNFHLVPRLGTVPADEFNGEHLRRFVQEVLETPPKVGNGYRRSRRSIDSMSEEELRRRKGTVNTLIGILRMALRMAWENGRIDNNRGWQSLRRIPNIVRPRVLHLSRPECRLLLAHCGKDLTRLILGALYTGCRITELLRMEASDVGRDGYGVRVKPSKSYRPRFVFLPDEGMAFFLALTKRKAPHEKLFIRDNGKEWYTYYRYALKSAVRSSGLPSEFSFHGLRHTYASQLIQAGAPLIVVAEQLGHANTVTVSQTYGHLSPQIREAEVRQRFTTVDRVAAQSAAKQRLKLSKWRNSLHGADWRTYASITDLRARARTL